MRGPALLVALLLPSYAPSVGAAEEPLLTDPAGDVTVTAEAGGAGLPALPSNGAENTKTADLLALAAVETDETIAFQVALASLTGPAVATTVDVDFGWDGGGFRLTLSYLRSEVFGGETNAWATLFKDVQGEWQWVARLPRPTIDDAAGTFATEVPKVYLVTNDGRVPGRGDVIGIASVQSASSGAFLPIASAEARDRMPDGEGAGASITLTRGDYSQGELVVSSPDRVRVSNGGATTFVFQATIRNTAAFEEEYALGVEDVPEGWDAKIQTPVKVPATSERTVSVLVSVPFEHEHGGYSSYNLTVQGTRDAASQARMRMGVLHTPIPQPAGHHPELYLHARDRDLGPYSDAVNSAFPMSWGWMNTDSAHEEDGTHVTPNNQGERAEWMVPLNPSLELGLDFDITKLGSIQGSILGKRDGDVKLRGALFYHQGRGEDAEQIKLADFADATITLSQQGATPFELVVTPTEPSDYIPYQPDASMYLTLSIDSTFTDGVRYASYFDAQLLTEDFVLSLPLNEYHDRLTGLAEAAQTIQIEARGAVEKTGLPGSVLTYAFTVKNAGPPDVFTLELAGNDAREGILVPRGDLSLATDETRDITLAVEIPIDANDAQEYEVLLFIHARDDPSKMAIARTKTRATHAVDQAQADESALLLDAQARETDVPAPGLLALALAVALALKLTSSPTKAARRPPPPR